jgi:predicted neuraminidase
MQVKQIKLVLLLFALVAPAAPHCVVEEPFFETGVVKAAASPKQRHAYPVIARTAGGQLLTVWTMIEAGQQDGKVVGALSRDGRSWSEPVTLIDIPGKLDADPNIVIDGHRILVYSTTVSIPSRIDKSEIWMTVSTDEGKSWSRPAEIKMPYKYVVGKRHIGIKLSSGALVMPFSWDLWAEASTPAQTEGEMDLKSGVLLSTDGGLTWTPHGNLHIFEPKVQPGAIWGVVEPALVELNNGELYMLLRTGTEWLYESRSPDGGHTWTNPTRSPLLGHNSPAALWRLDQNPKEIIVIWNNSPSNRYPLTVAISADGGRSWSRPKVVATSDGPQVSYPGITQSADGMFIAVWQQQLPNGGRDIRWARFNRAWVLKD